MHFNFVTQVHTLSCLFPWLLADQKLNVLNSLKTTKHIFVNAIPASQNIIEKLDLHFSNEYLKERNTYQYLYYLNDLVR